VISAINNTHAIDYCNTVAETYLKKASEALTPLSESPYKHSLRELITFCQFRAL